MKKKKSKARDALFEIWLFNMLSEGLGAPFSIMFIIYRNSFFKALVQLTSHRSLNEIV